MKRIKLVQTLNDAWLEIDGERISGLMITSTNVSFNKKHIISIGELYKKNYMLGHPEPFFISAEVQDVEFRNETVNGLQPI